MSAFLGGPNSGQVDLFGLAPLISFSSFADPLALGSLGGGAAVCRSAFVLLVIIALNFGVHAQSQSQAPQAQADVNSKRHSSGFIQNITNLLNMAGGKKSSEFRPMTQRDRNRLYFRTMVNPLSFVRCAASAGIDQGNDKPVEWEQGASGYGKRFANILGQYSIQRTATYGIGSALHEDNRYFNSGTQGFWPRTGYALASGILARHDDGTRHFSISQVGGVAAGAFLARPWLPQSQSSAGSGAVSFGITMASNMGFGVVKEFLPDMMRPFTKKHQNP
jgi:hypothetical protein